MPQQSEEILIYIVYAVILVATVIILKMPKK
jgi:hypothetical protein